MKKRFLSAVLALLMCLSLLSNITAADTADGVVDLSKALHFYIRHWHSDPVTEGTRFQSGSQESVGRYFVVAEGYIVPENGSYGFYFVYQNDVDNDDIKAKAGDIEELTKESVAASGYIKDIYPETGTIVIKANPLDEEDFSGFSISAGHDAVAYEGDTVKITYDEAVHLVKGHAFYIKERDGEAGTADEAVFSADGLVGNDPEVDTAEVDTAWVYTYTEDCKDDYGTHKAGDIVKVDGKAFGKDDDLPEGVDEAVKLTKFYSTTAGMHTDKTAAAYSDGRTFDLTLEAWYAEKDPPLVGMVLDASGSMGFASDVPQAINVNKLMEAQRQTIEAKSVNKLTEAQWQTIEAKIGALANMPSEASYVYPERDKLIGYYPFNGSSVSETKTYTLNAADLDTFGAGGKSSGDTTLSKDGYFTLIWADNSRVEISGSNTRINFSGTLDADTKIRSAKFTTNAPAEVTVTWSVGGSANLPRNIIILNEDGTTAAGPTTDGVAYDNKQLTSTLYLGEAGTYYLGNHSGNNWIYKIEVTERLSSADDEALKNGASETGSYATFVSQQTSGGISFSPSDTPSSPISDGKLVVKNGAFSGVMLDAEPDDDFTISFTVNKNSNGDTSGVDQEPVDVMYVGAQAPSSNNYLRVIREKRVNGKSEGPYGSVQRAWLTGYQGDPTDGPFGTAAPALPNNAVSAASAFNTSNTYYLTYVYKDGQLTTYFANNTGTIIDLNETSKTGYIEPTHALNLDGRNIVLGGFVNSYNGAEIYIDNVFVYNTALEESDVTKLVKAINTNKGINEKEDAAIDWENDVFLTPAEQDLLLNPHNNDYSKLSPSGYSYFVYDAREGTAEYTPLGYYRKGGTNVVKPNNADATGWYYSSYHSNWGTYTSSKTTKTLQGIIPSAYTDTIKVVMRVPESDYGKCGAAPDAQTDDPNRKNYIDPNKGNTGIVYTAAENGPVKFYIDKEGYLRCFFATGNVSNSGRFTSYVYELSDKEYVKTESLQRALGDFVTRLSEKSPQSKVSAVRFSLPTTETNSNGLPKNQLNRLVLLDWTDNAGESAHIMSMLRGDNGKASDDGLTQYNYFLTGGTNTNTGLQAFKDNLSTDAKLDKLGDGDKYLIIFTDGADTGDKNAAKKIADELKKDGYTIFTVLLNGGPVKEGREQYDTAHNFLLTLAGKDGYENGDKAENYFFSVDKGRRELENDDVDTANMNDADILTQIFSKEILKQIIVDQEDYTVQDYIDPRFDLTNVGVSTVVEVEKTDTDGKKTTVKEIVSSENTYTINLKSNGRIELVRSGGDGYDVWLNLNDGSYRNLVHPIKDKDGKYHELKPIKDKDGKYYVLLNLASASDNAEHPLLYWDNNNEMYYLKWTEQTIPGCAVGADRLSVWKAKFTIKAKEDFLGGNGVLTNGNLKNMNYVFDPKDKAKDASSGTDDCVPGSNTDSPSKGFPRTTVNVALLPLKIGNSENRIYLGEVIDPSSVIESLGYTVSGNYYWIDYLMRYAPSYIKGNGGKVEDLSPEKLMEKMMQALVDNPSGWGLDLPYYYLPNVLLDENGNRLPSDNQPGNAYHQSDQLGILHYRWERLDPATGEVIGVGGYTSTNGKDDGSTGGDGDALTGGPYKGKPYDTLDTRRIEYRLVVSYWPFPDANDDFWQELDEWNSDSTLTDSTSRSPIQIALDKMCDLLGAAADSENGGGLSALIQSANTDADFRKIEDKYEEIKSMPDDMDLPDKVKHNGAFNALLEEVHSALYDDATTITIKTTGADGEISTTVTIPGGLQGLLKKLDEAREDTTSQTLRVYIENALFKLRNDIENKTSRISNYFDYLRWCYGYGETDATDSNGEPIQGWIEGSEKLKKRADENNKLIQEVYSTNDGDVYAYHKPKDAVGPNQYNKTAVGMHTTRIVRGELAFNLELMMYELESMFEDGDWKEYKEKGVPYVMKLSREYSAELAGDSLPNNDWNPKIPDLQINITWGDLQKLSKGKSEVKGEIQKSLNVVTLYYTEMYVDSDGEQKQRATNYPKAVYYSNTDKVIYYSDPRVFDPVYEGYEKNSDYARLLPIGEYTMKPSPENAELWSLFVTDLAYAPDENYAFDGWHFTRTTNEGEPNNSVDSIYFPRSGRSQSKGLGQLKAPELNRAMVAITDEDGNTVKDKDGNELVEPDPTGKLKEPEGGVVFQLGTKEYDEDNYYSGTGKDIPQYTDDRIGMARVKARLKIELPSTGATGTNRVFLLGPILIALVACFLFLQRRKDRVRAQK